MAIYNLDDKILVSNKNKSAWTENIFLQCIQIIDEDSVYKIDWEYGENWCRVYDENTLIGMLCFRIPFLISSTNQIIHFLPLLPFNIEVIFITDFYKDKIVISKICQDLIEPMSSKLDCPAFIQDFYVTTV